jgi:hypothetical protein
LPDIPPISYVLFVYGALRGHDDLVFGPEVPLHPSVIIPPAIAALGNYFLAGMRARTPVEGLGRFEVASPSDCPPLPAGLLAAAMAEVEPMYEAHAALTALDEINYALNSIHYETPTPSASPSPEPLDSQDTFLSSLKPIDIESVDKDSRKCGICWKPYGEAPDPGQDNSEQPVRLQCSHAFGNKCLKDLFAKIPNSEVELRELRFDNPTSRACELGRKLEALLGNAPEDTHESTIFNALKMNVDRSKGVKVFGGYWWVIFAHLKNAVALDVSCITLMDNAVVLDPMPMESKKGPRDANFMLTEALDSALAIEQVPVSTTQPASRITPQWVRLVNTWKNMMRSSILPILINPSTGSLPTPSKTASGANNSTGMTPEVPQEEEEGWCKSLFDVLTAIPFHLLQPLAAYMVILGETRVPLYEARYNRFLEAKAHELMTRGM